MTDTTPPAATQASVAAAVHPQPRPQQAGRGRQSAPPQHPARLPRAVHPVLQQLFGLYPKLFGSQFLPLKLGVFQDLLALHPEHLKREDLKVALGLHARSTRYLESVAAGLPRHDLNGGVVEAVAPEHVHHAIMEIFKRRQARSDQDLRPFARAQLVRAIEASGLGREDYLLCIRQQDEVSQGLLDDVFAELAAQAAKGDALLRTFEASGKTVAEFADMYGMDVQAVASTLERARQRMVAQPENPAEAPLLQAHPAASIDAAVASTA